MSVSDLPNTEPPPIPFAIDSYNDNGLLAIGDLLSCAIYGTQVSAIENCKDAKHPCTCQIDQAWKMANLIWLAIKAIGLFLVTYVVQFAAIAEALHQISIRLRVPFTPYERTIYVACIGIPIYTLTYFLLRRKGIIPRHHPPDSYRSVHPC